jgi:hexokinase
VPFSYHARSFLLTTGPPFVGTIELIRWTKGFGNPNTEGHDVAKMFSEALERAVRFRRDMVSSPA